jgi:hypothetical protein
MPADRRSKPAASRGHRRGGTHADEPASNEPARNEPAQAANPSTAADDSGPPTLAPAAAAAADMTEAPLNRAERRARKAGKGPQQLPGKGKVGQQKGPVQTPRIWANRRSG